MMPRIVRIVAALAVLGLLIYFGFVDLKVLRGALTRPDLVVLAALLLLLTIPLAAFRWWLLLTSLDFPLGFRWSLRTTFTSQFFHTFLPGAYGGDLVRAALTYRATGRRLSRISFTIVVDRLSGLVALLILALGMLPFLPPQFRDSAYPVLAMGAVAMIGGTIFGLTFGEAIARLLSRLPAPIGSRLAHVVREVLGAVRAYFDRWLTLVSVLVLSLFQFVLALAALMLIGWSMKFNSLSVSGYMVAGAWSIVANALPVTPGGLGVGEVAFSQIAALLETGSGGPSYATVFLGMRVLTVLISVAGFLPYLAQRGEVLAAAPIVAAEAEGQAAEK